MAKPLRISSIKLTGYKNYSASHFLFNERIIGICGNNGKGKTNLLDAIYYLCFTRSYFNRSDSLNVRFGNEGFRIEGEIKTGSNKINRIVCVYRPETGKEIYDNEVAYEKFSKHLGKYPAVLIAPDDIALISGGSEERRKYLDTQLSQINELYLQQLILYSKLLAQRNAHLKSEAQNQKREDLLLESIDNQIIPLSESIYQQRIRFCEKLFPVILKFYTQICGGNEALSIRFESHIDGNNTASILKKNLHKDRILQRTSSGIHRDEIIFEFNSNLFRNIASQGQRKSLLFACRLAELEVLQQETSIAPILLLDDVFEKLDSSRIRNLLEYLCHKNESQVFITDTDQMRLSHAIADLNNTIQIIPLN